MPSDLQRLRTAVGAAIRYGTLLDLYDALDAYHEAVDAEIQTLREGLIGAAAAADLTAEILQEKLDRTTVRRIIDKLRARARRLGRPGEARNA